MLSAIANSPASRQVVRFFSHRAAWLRTALARRSWLLWPPNSCGPRSRRRWCRCATACELATNVYLPDGRRALAGGAHAHAVQQGGRRETRESRSCRTPSRGYVRIVQDCRGKFGSEGVYRAFIDDMEDGYDTVEWAAAQSWSNGKVGMVGGSAMGITANHAAMSGAPHLVCNVVYRRPRQLVSLLGLSGRRVSEEPERGMAAPAGCAAGRRAAADPSRLRRFVPPARHRALLLEDHSRPRSTSAAGTTSSARATSTASSACNNAAGRAGQGEPEAGDGRLRSRQAGRRFASIRPTLGRPAAPI